MDAESLSRVRRFGPPAFIVLLAAAASALVIPVFGWESTTVAEPRIPVLALAVVWLLFDLVVLNLRYGKDLDNGNTLVLTEVPLALGLLFTTPVELLLIAVMVPVLLDLLRRRQSLIKQVFNGVLRVLDISVALTLYRALEPDEPLSPEGWAVLALVVTVTGAVSALAVTTVISLAIGRWSGRDFLTHTVWTVPLSLMAATLGAVAGLALQAGGWTAVPLLVTLIALLALMRGFSVLTERHMNLALLHTLGQRLVSTREPESILATALEAAQDLLAARRAEVHVASPHDPERLVRVARGPDGGLVQTAVERDEALLQCKGVLDDRSGVVAATPAASGLELVVSVTGRAAGMRPFAGKDAQLLDMVAQQTGAHLHTAQLIEQLRHDALHDALTDLPNRRALLAELQDRTAHGSPTGVVWLGIRDLQLVNAALGHDHGDELLVQVGRRLQAASGPEAVVARVAGDEFAILLPGVESFSDCVEPVAALLASLESPFLLSRVQVVVRACTGVAVATEAGAAAQDLLLRADVAMRHSRRTGRPVERYRADLETATPSRLALAADLQGGISRNELVLHAQPQVRLEDGAVIGVEALVRWNHPRLGLLYPDAFVPLAEQTGLDRPMTGWVLNAALETMAGWRSAGLDLSVSVNVPPSALGDGQLRDLTYDLLSMRDVPGEQLVIEMTESLLLTSTSMAAEHLRNLSALGVKVSIDDFGTGFSSLSHLRRLPVDEVKIDRSFVSTMLDDEDDAAIVRSVVNLSRDLGLTCVAEGVESQDVYAALQKLGCDVVQGYHLARPMPVAEIADWAHHRGSSRPA